MDEMFDFSGYYDRIAQQMPDDCRVVECGVADGASALYLAKELNRLGRKFTLYMVDNLDYGKYIQLCTIYENVIKSGLGESIKVLPHDSRIAAELFNDGFLDFVYIDSSHEYEETLGSIKAWWPKLKDGGVLAGHDFQLYPTVKQAVEELLPYRIKRETLYSEEGELEQEFEEEEFLHVEGTDRGNGLWWVQKDFYKKLNV